MTEKMVTLYLSHPDRCGKRESECVCERTARHKIHRCACGGSWVYNEAAAMVPRTYPGGHKNALSALYRMLDPFGGMFR
jgi:hypothetical protein